VPGIIGQAQRACQLARPRGTDGDQHIRVCWGDRLRWKSRLQLPDRQIVKMRRCRSVANVSSIGRAEINPVRSSRFVGESHQSRNLRMVS
jgi:hypothetical protein